MSSPLEELNGPIEEIARDSNSGLRGIKRQIRTSQTFTKTFKNSPDENEIDQFDLSYEALSLSYQESSSKIRLRPDIARFYKTPSSTGSKFSRRRSSLKPQIDYFATYNLPEEVLLRICQYFNKKDLICLAQTCRRFRSACYNAKFWKFLNLGNTQINESALHTMLDRRTEIVRLAGGKIYHERLASWYELPAEIPSRLTHLDLTQVTFSSVDVLINILERCNLLQALSLEHYEFVGENVFTSIACNTQLHTLDFMQCRGITPTGMAEIFKRCKRLAKVNLAWTSLDGATIDVISTMAPKTLLQLSISGCNNSLKDSHVLKLCKSAPFLQELDLGDNIDITEESVSVLAKMRVLKKLHLSRCYGIEPMAYLTLTQLDMLNIYGCLADSGVEALRQRLHPVLINAEPFVDVARPTVGEQVTSIWGQRTRDLY